MPPLAAPLSSSRCCCCPPLPPAAAPRPAARAAPPAAPCRTRRLSAPRAGPDGGPSEFEGVGGDRDVQDALVEQLRIQVESETLKEEIKEDLKAKVEGLKQIGEELISQLDAELGIEKFRTELESSQVLSDANEKLNELEEQLQQIKDQIKADQADLRAFEEASASARSQGLFFQSLYQAPGDEEEDGASAGQGAAAGGPRSRGAPLDPAAARAAAAAVVSSAEEEVGSPFRAYLFGYMAAVLAIVVVQDLSTPEPKLALDGLYGVLGLLLGVNAYNERRVLQEELERRRLGGAAGPPQQQQQSGGSGSS